MKRIVVVLILTLTVAAAFACNGGDGGAPTAQPTITPSSSAVASASATAAPPTPSGSGQIAYLGPEGADIWLINADGSGQRKLTEGQCQQAMGPFWSRGGDKIACASGGTADAPTTKIAVFDLEGQTLTEVEQQAWLRGFAWSPDDRHFVYIIAEGEALDTARLSLIISDAGGEATTQLGDTQDARWSPDGAQLALLKTTTEELIIYDLTTGKSKILGQGLRPLAWALEGKALLVATGYQQQEFGADYEANLLDLASGQMARVPELDNSTQFWLSRDGQVAAFLAGKARRDEGGASISILDLATLKVTPIEGAAIGYPSEGIPSAHIAFSEDDTYLYWVDVVAKSGQDLSGTIYRARSDGSEPGQLGVLNGVLFSFSPDRTMVVYSDGSALWVAGVDGGNARSLVEGVGGGRWPPAVWQPLPTP